MTINYGDIAELHAGGSSPQQIADVLNGLHVHKRECPITSNGRDNLLNLLTVGFGVMWQDTAQSWVGPLVDAESEAGNELVALGMGLLRPHLQVRDTDAAIHQSERMARAFNATVDVAASLAVGLGTAESTQQVWDAVNAITGGRKFLGVTAADVQEAIDRTVSEQRIADLENDYSVMGQNDIDRALAKGDRQGLIDALKTTAKNLEA